MTTPAPEQDGNDLHLLRCHIEASWGLRVPPLGPPPADVTLPASSAGAPPWALYAALAGGAEVHVWRDAPLAARADLLQRARAALAQPGAAPGDGVVTEVVFRRVHPAAAPPVPARRLTNADAALLEAFEPGETEYWLDPRRGPLFGVVAGGRLLSVAHSSRRTAHACELGINTLPDARRQGFARACVLAWANAVTAEGLHPLYSANAANAPSLALARACGYRPLSTAAQVADTIK